MDPIALRTDRLLLDQPTLDDIDAITETCRGPECERFLTTPWPYEREHARGFVADYVPDGWRTGGEATWAIRLDGRFAGVIGVMVPTSEVGFWLVRELRGRGIMPEAVRAVAEWAVSDTGLGLERLGWQCLPGNAASVAVARKSGFEFTGWEPAWHPTRDGAHPDSPSGRYVPLAAGPEAARAARESWQALDTADWG